MTIMKKVLIYIIGLFLITGCSQNDNILKEDGGQDNTVDVHVGIEATRAGGSNAIPTGCTMRIIMEVYKAGQTDCVLRTVRTTTDNAVYTTGFTMKDIQLASGNSYYAVLWADFGNTYYNAASLKDIAQLSVGKDSKQDDAEDAYSATFSFAIDKDGTPDKKLSVSLTRALNKVVFNKVQIQEAVMEQTVTATPRFKEFKTLSCEGTVNIIYDKIYTHFNAYTQKLIQSDAEGYTRAVSRNISVESGESFTVYDYVLGDDSFDYNVNAKMRFVADSYPALSDGLSYEFTTNHIYGLPVKDTSDVQPMRVPLMMRNEKINVGKKDDAALVLKCHNHPAII
jgi:hypothetical protein